MRILKSLRKINKKDFIDTYQEILPKEFCPERDEFQLDNVVEIALRSDKYNKSELEDLIKLIIKYSIVKSKTISLDEMMMLKVLAFYGAFDLFEKILEHFKEK